MILHRISFGGLTAPIVDMMLGREYFTFNSIDPMPQDLVGIEGKHAGPCVAAYIKMLVNTYQTYCKENPTSCNASYMYQVFPKIRTENMTPAPAEEEKSLIDPGRYYMENLIKYGDFMPVDWMCRHWGNPADAIPAPMFQKDDVEGVSFFTNWPIPLDCPIYKALMRKFKGFNIFWDSALIEECGADRFRISPDIPIQSFIAKAQSESEIIENKPDSREWHGSTVIAIYNDKYEITQNDPHTSDWHKAIERNNWVSMMPVLDDKEETENG